MDGAIAIVTVGVNKQARQPIVCAWPRHSPCAAALTLRRTDNHPPNAGCNPPTHLGRTAPPGRCGARLVGSAHQHAAVQITQFGCF